MKAIGNSLPFIILLCGIGGMLGLKSLKQDPPSSKREVLPQLVDTVAVEPCEDGFTLKVDGVVVPFREISLASRVAGQILKKSPSARAGEYVREGELLFEVDPSDYELEARRLKESLKQAGSSIEESDIEKTNIEELLQLAQKSLTLQQQEVARFETLKAKNATTTSRLEAVRQSELQSMNSLQGLANQVTMVNARRNRLLQERERANTMLEQALLNLSRTKITAPSDGVVMEDLAEQDDYVQVGAPLVRIEDTSKVEVRFSLRMDQLRWLWSSAVAEVDETQQSYRLPQLAVRIKVDIDGNRFFWPARLDRYDGAGINASTRTVPVIAIVDDPRAVQSAGKDANALPLPGPPTLMRNTFVSVEVPIRNSMNLVRIPTEALRPDEKIWMLKDGKFHEQEVKVAHSSPKNVVLFADPTMVAVGDRVIVSPLSMVSSELRLRDKDSLSTKDAAMSTADSETESDSESL